MTFTFISCRLGMMVPLRALGLWHGASWTFVVWGGLHGLFLSAERVLRARFAGYRPGPVTLVGLGLLTYALVNVTWVFFRAHSFAKAWLLLRGMLGANTQAVPILPTMHLTMVAAIVAGIVFTHWRMRDQTLEMAIAHMPAAVLSGVWALMLFAIVISQGSGNAFIYFQF